MTANTASILPPASFSEEHLLALCKASADQLRLAVLRVLSRDSYGVLELCRIFDHKQSGMSHHLKILARAGLVNARREGNSIFYRRAVSAKHPELNELQKSLLATADQLALSARAVQGIREVKAERELLSRQFFARHAGAFHSQQELIADHLVYSTATAELLTEQQPGTRAALEVGPGQGLFLAELAARFEDLYALDTSCEMLEQAKSLANRQQLNNITFIHGDTGHASLPTGFDCIVACMVLHHVPSPADLFEDLSRLLRPGGLLCITDLCHHDQAWTQQACGDLWLGFEPTDLNTWAEQAGLTEGKAAYLAQRNGFQLQVRQFIKPANPDRPAANS